MQPQHRGWRRALNVCRESTNPRKGRRPASGVCLESMQTLMLTQQTATVAKVASRLVLLITTERHAKTAQPDFSRWATTAKLAILVVLQPKTTECVQDPNTTGTKRGKLTSTRATASAAQTMMPTAFATSSKWYQSQGAQTPGRAISIETRLLTTAIVRTSTTRRPACQNAPRAISQRLSAEIKHNTCTHRQTKKHACSWPRTESVF